MRYRNTPRFQYVLQTALNILGQDKGYSDQKIIDQAKLGCSKSTVNRFRLSQISSEIKKMPTGVADLVIDRVAGSYLNSKDARKLWTYLDDQGLIEQGLSIRSIRKKTLYTIDDVASSMVSFFETHQSSVVRFTRAGISGNFFCFKPSFRRPGFIVKSLMTIRPIRKDYFEVTERQRVSGLFEMDRMSITEISEGFGLVKSDRVWLFLRDVESEQPRIFCFYKPKFSQSSHGTTELSNEIYNNRISSMNGYLIEGSRGNENNAFSFNVVLIAEDVDRDLWKNQFPEGAFELEEQIDVFPVRKDQLLRYKKQFEEKNVFIPEEIIEYLGINTKID